MNPAPAPSPTPPTKPRSLGRFAFNAFVVIGAILTLAAIIIPIIGSPRESGCRRSVASSNLRQVGQASMIYASYSQDQLPQVDDIHAFAFQLARLGGLNDATIWIIGSDDPTGLSTVLSSDRKSLLPTFAATRPSYAAAVRGLKINHPPTTPIAWTRGLQPDGTWSKDSPHGGDGGHIVFLGGNVSFYRDLKQSNTLLRFDGQGTTSDIRAALPPDAVIANN